MSNVIGFFEAMGKNASLQHGAQRDLAPALDEAKIDPELQTAIMSSDLARIGALLGAKTNVSCAQFPVKEDEDDSEDSPSRDDDEITFQSAAYRVAVAR
jgi:hypothetical protein